MCLRGVSRRLSPEIWASWRSSVRFTKWARGVCLRWRAYTRRRPLCITSFCATTCWKQWHLLFGAEAYPDPCAGQDRRRHSRLVDAVRNRGPMTGVRTGPALSPPRRVDATVLMKHTTDSAPLGSATTEAARLRQNGRGAASWKYWGPYLSERQWGTVREDYSRNGNAWEYLPHDHARSRAYRWGEDGIAGFSDVNQHLCLAVALWNEHDPILKERLFGLTNSEGNHGEDVKELYYYLDATPSHSYLKMLYKYPQAAFPYRKLLEENQRRGIRAPEFELLDTGVFDSNRYFDVFVEYAQAAPGDILLRVTAHNRGP